MARPMPRSKALRLLVGALVSASAPGMLGRSPAAARASPARAKARSGSQAGSCRTVYGQGLAPDEFQCPGQACGSRAGDCCGAPDGKCCTDGTLGFPADRNGYYCCPQGCDCYKGWCCPPGGGRGMDKRGSPLCCDPGWSVEDGVCVRCTRARKCGKKCCEKGQYCASKASALCCDNDDQPCLVLGEPGMPRDAGKGGKCCPKGTSKCCQNNKRSNCCDALDNCCAGRCCPPAKQCDTKTGTCRCPKNTKICGRDCCKQGKNAEKCCDDHCCKSTQACCGKDCCGKGEQCCNNSECCKKSEGETCCKEAGCCTSDEVCMKSALRVTQGRSSPFARRIISNVCCPKARALTPTYCCPSGTVAGRTRLTKTCCPPSQPNCCGELGCGPGDRCINGTCKQA